jgi:hypothetical protein
VRISRIRLSEKRFIADVFRQLRVAVYSLRSRLIEPLIVSAPFRRSAGPLAAPFRMSLETATNVPVDFPEGLA